MWFCTCLGECRLGIWVAGLTEYITDSVEFKLGKVLQKVGGKIITAQIFVGPWLISSVAEHVFLETINAKSQKIVI